MSLLQMSFSGAVMIIVIAALRVFTMNKLPKKTFLVLWYFVLLRLLLPFSLPSIFSAYTLIERHTPVMEAVQNTPAENLLPLSTALPDTNTLLDAFSNLQSGDFSTNTFVSTQPVVVPSIWTILWSIGVLICFLYFALSYAKCYKMFQISLPVENSFVRNWLNSHPLKRTISLRQASCISTPLTYGVLRPVILLPKNTDFEKTESLQFVLAHEYVHIKRMDTLTKLIIIAALCIHWFNPMVWLMFALANRDMELSCDESVIRLLGADRKSSYARTLISMEAAKSGLSPLYNGFSKNAMEERITAIMKTKKLSFTAIVFAVLLVFGVVTVFATSSSFADNAAPITFQKDENAPALTLSPQILQYQGMTYQKFKKQTDINAEFYHAEFYASAIPDTNMNAIFRASNFDEELAVNTLTKNDRIIRLEGNLAEIFSDLTNEMALEDFIRNLTWSNGISPDYQLQEGAGTAYYIADSYVEIRFDSNGDMLHDMLLQVSLGQSDKIGPTSYAWLIFDN